jgi:hypothetical protein
MNHVSRSASTIRDGDIDRRIAQIDGAVEEAASKGRAGSAMVPADQQRKVRADLVAQRTPEARTHAELVSIDGESRLFRSRFPRDWLVWGRCLQLTAANFSSLSISRSSAGSR